MIREHVENELEPMTVTSVAEDSDGPMIMVEHNATAAQIEKFVEDKPYYLEDVSEMMDEPNKAVLRPETTSVL